MQNCRETQSRLGASKGKTMDILSEKTLTILRDENVRKAVDEILDGRASDSKTVQLAESSIVERSTNERQVTRVRLRRIA